jgi:ATP-dependent DNA ligase
LAIGLGKTNPWLTALWVRISLRGVSREELPRFLAPMLVGSGPLPEDDCWAVEVKWDGARAQARVDGRVCVRSRPGRDCTEQFPELAELASGGRRLLLDCELVCLDADGKPDFGALRQRLAAHGRAVEVAARRDPATLIIFDVLHHDGERVRGWPYRERRELLDSLKLDGAAWRTPVSWVGETAAFARVTREHGLEGVVYKRLDSPWVEGRRTSAWVKVKHRRRQVLRVTGWVPGRDGEPDEYLLARGPVPAGSVSFGLDAERRALITARERPATAAGGCGGSTTASWSRSMRMVGRTGQSATPCLRSFSNRGPTPSKPTS